MKTLEHSLEILNQIIDGKTTFSEVMNKKISELNVEAKEKDVIKDVIKGTINRYYFLEWEIKRAYAEELNPEELKLMILALAETRFEKKVSFEDILEELKHLIESVPYLLDYEKASKVLTELKNQITPIPENIQKVFCKKVALQYAYPEWVLRMFWKHFGAKDSFKSVASSRRNTALTVAVNPLKANRDELLKNNECYISGGLSKTSLKYISKDKIINLPEFKKCEIYVMEDSEQLLIEKLDPKNGESVTIIANDKGQLALTSTIRMSGTGKINYLTNDGNLIKSAGNIISKFGFKNVDIHECEPNLAITYAGEQDKVLVLSPSSELGLVRRHPDVLVTLKRDALDEIISIENEYIEEASLLVKKGGILMYAVATMNHKESTSVVNNFLSAHPDFELVEDRQIFPYEGNSEGMYYAKLLKKEN